MSYLWNWKSVCFSNETIRSRENTIYLFSFPIQFSEFGYHMFVNFLKKAENGTRFRFLLITILFQVFEARFKRRILHAPNRIAELSACKMRRLNQLWMWHTVIWKIILDYYLRRAGSLDFLLICDYYVEKYLASLSVFYGELQTMCNYN